jgi:hypothetical protein
MLTPTMHRLVPLLIAISATACAAPPATEPRAPERASPPEPAKPATTNVEAPKPPSDVRIAVQRQRVSLNGRAFAVDTPTKLRKVEPLFAELMDLHLAGAGPRYLLSVADGATGLELKSSFQTAAFAGWTVARWEAGPRPVTLKALIPLPPGAQPSAADTTFPKEPLVVVVRTDGVDVLRLRIVPPGKAEELKRDEDGQFVPVAELIGQAPSATLDADLGVLLARECTLARPCLPGVLFVEGAADTSLVRRSVALLASLGSSEHGSELQLRASEPVARGEPFRLGRLGPVGMKVGQTTISGRLPPALIQSTIRKNYDVFRKCYEQGLGRDAKLRGKVTARFVIGRDGKVSNVTDGGSDLPDAVVVACVLKAFQTIIFPAPEGGIVTVIYPINLEPG